MVTISQMDIEKIIQENENLIKINFQISDHAFDILLFLMENNLTGKVFGLEISEDLDVEELETRNRLFHLASFFEYLGKFYSSNEVEKKFYRKLASDLVLDPKKIKIGEYFPVNETLSFSGKLNHGYKRFKGKAKKALKPYFLSSNGNKRLVVNKKEGTERNPKNWQAVLITGWYGTETTGDKAILGEIIFTLKRYNPNIKITITSIDLKVSYQTNFEMDMLEHSIIPINEASKPEIIEKFDAVIMGGGPIMESRQIHNIFKIFREANNQQKERVIFGCGVGPIHTPEMENLIYNICNLSTAGFFRDQESKEYAKRIGANNIFPVACDPAVAYVKRWADANPKAKNEDGSFIVKTLLREQTKEYYTSSNLEGKVNRFISDLSGGMDKFLKENENNGFDLLPMHMYWKGNDDRLFNRKILKYLSTDHPINIVRGYLDLNSLLRRLQEGNASIAMRYHGHLFSLSLGIPFVSIDYTGKKGKISNLMGRIGMEEASQSFSNFDVNSIFDHLSYLKENNAEVSKKLQSKTLQLIAELEDAYIKNWGSPL